MDKILLEVKLLLKYVFEGIKMRLRNVKGAADVLKESEFVIDAPKEYRGKWSSLFDNSNPIRIEVGMGKGKFIVEMAKRNPEINYIGIEMYSSVLVRAVQKLTEEEIPNLYFICMNAEELPLVFSEGEVDRIYLNFSDPWPKDRHAKRRLTSPQFMKRYDAVLKVDGIVEFKTDNVDLFRYSLESIPEAGWRITQYTEDLHNNEMVQGNVMTEYEEKFVKLGNNICKLIACR